jgi:hypothetical protein
MSAPPTKLRSLSLTCTAALLTGLVVLGSACKKNEKTVDDDDEVATLAEDGSDSVSAEADTEVLTSSLVSAAIARPGGSLTLASTSDLGGGDLGTRGVGDGAKALYFPRNCLTVTSDEAAKKVTYGFANCFGPNGIAKISGQVVATYEASAGKLMLNLVGTDLRVNKSVIDWSATAEISADGVARTMRWKGALSGTTARGKEFSRTNEKVVTWSFGERCFGLSGISEGKVRGRYLRTEISDFRRCQGSCPEAGGKISISNEAKLKVEILFDGSDRATYTSPKGSTTISLDSCQG